MCDLLCFILTVQNIRLEPVTAAGILSLVLNIMCASLNIIRGVHLIEYSFQVSVISRHKSNDTPKGQTGHYSELSVKCITSFHHSQDDYEGIWNVVAFFVAFVCCVCQVKIRHHPYLTRQTEPSPVVVPSRSRPCPQCHLYLFHSALKKHKAWALWTAVVLCNLYLVGPRNPLQLMFHVAVASLSAFLTFTRKLQDRSGDCGV